jgi:histidinol-phosphatase (PHP family)
MHTPLCGHASGHPLQYVEQAAKVGLQRITFTCHIPMRFAGFGQDGIRMRRDQLPLYREIVAQARDHGESLGVEVLCGIEAEIHPHQPFMEEMDAILQTEPFDFVLGSLHHMLPAFRDWLNEQGHHSDETIIEAYFNCIGQAALSGRYHSLAHPDVIRVYNTLKGPFLPENHKEAIHRFLERVREAGICLEINTSGRIKGDYIAHPDPLIADWALGMEIPFTIGSDSHTPERVGDGFAETLNTLQSLGLREVLGFKQGKPTVFKLDDPVGLAIANA